MICSRCKVDKEESQFIHGKTKCHECYRKCKAYYESHREQAIARAEKSNAKKDRTAENKRKREACRKNPVAYMLWGVKSRAKARGIPFDLTHDDIEIPDTCPILGIPLRIGDGTPTANSPSLDRIDPNYGYVKGNVQVISYRANTIKSDATKEELKLVLEHLLNVKPYVGGEQIGGKISRHHHQPLKNKKILE
jgi:hypothetical protein